MMYRAMVVGLLGAIALLVAAPRQVAPPAQPGWAPNGGPRDATVVDVSLAHAGGDLMPLLGLEPGERVTMDTSELNQRWRKVFPGDYLDVGVHDPRGEERRILVLVHP